MYTIHHLESTLLMEDMGCTKLCRLWNRLKVKMSLKLYVEHNFWPKSCIASAPSQFHLEYNERRRFLLETLMFGVQILFCRGGSAYLIGLPPVLTSSQTPTPPKFNISFPENFAWKTFSFPFGPWFFHAWVRIPAPFCVDMDIYIYIHIRSHLDSPKPRPFLLVQIFRTRSCC